MAICVDTECKTYVRGEIVPIVVEVTSETDMEFEIVQGERTYCEIRDSGDILLGTVPGIVKNIEGTKKQVFSSWNTTNLEIGYYTLRMWVSINFYGLKDNTGEWQQDFLLVSPKINRHLRDS